MYNKAIVNFVDTVTMANDTLQQQALIAIVNDYLQGATLAQIELSLKKLCNTTHHNAKYLYQHAQIDAIACQTLFQTLNLPQELASHYDKSESLFVLLKRLHEDGYGHNHLDYLLKRINHIKPQRFWRRVMIAVVSTMGVGSYFIATQQNPLRWLYELTIILFPSIVLNWLKRTFSLLKNIPLVAIIYNSCWLVWDVFNRFYYGFANIKQKLIATAFDVLTKGAIIVGYVITIVAAGVATPVAGILFIFSAMMDVAESIVNFISIMNKPLLATAQQTHAQQIDQVRQKNQQRLVSNTLWIKVSAAILTSVAVAVWCFCPLNFVLVLSVIASMILISTIKSMVINQIEYNHSVWLQTEIRRLPIHKAATLTPKSLTKSSTSDKPNVETSHPLRFFKDSPTENPPVSAEFFHQQTHVQSP